MSHTLIKFPEQPQTPSRRRKPRRPTEYPAHCYVWVEHPTKPHWRVIPSRVAQVEATPEVVKRGDPAQEAIPIDSARRLFALRRKRQPTAAEVQYFEEHGSWPRQAALKETEQEDEAAAQLATSFFSMVLFGATMLIVMLTV